MEDYELERSGRRPLRFKGSKLGSVRSRHVIYDLFQMETGKFVLYTTQRSKRRKTTHTCRVGVTAKYVFESQAGYRFRGQDKFPKLLLNLAKLAGIKLTE